MRDSKTNYSFASVLKFGLLVSPSLFKYRPSVEHQPDELLSTAIPHPQLLLLASNSDLRNTQRKPLPKKHI